MAKVNIPHTVLMSIFMEAAEEAMKIVQLNVQQDIKKMLNLGGPGAPSKPGRPPHKQTGNLARSWQYGPAPIRKGNAELTMTYSQARIGSATEYAAALEYGYKPRNLKPRPYLRRVIRSKKKSKFADKVFRKEFEKAATNRANKAVQIAN